MSNEETAPIQTSHLKKKYVDHLRHTEEMARVHQEYYEALNVLLELRPEMGCESGGLPKALREVLGEAKVYAILDAFHPHVNGDETPEIRSDDECWGGHPDRFFEWCCHHGAYKKWYEVEK